jgi:hypothetical protein
MSVTGVVDNKHTFIKRAGNVNSGIDVSSIDIGDNGMKDVPPTLSYPDIISRDSDLALGDKNMQKRQGIQHYFSHEEFISATGYDIHGNKIVPEAATTVTFANDEAGDDNTHSDAGTWYGMRSNVVDESSFPTK